MRNISVFDEARSRFRMGVKEVDRKRGWYLALGILLLILGSIASGAVVTTTLISVMALGWILVISGAGLIVASFLTGNWSGFLLTLAAGVLSALAGVEIFTHPVAGAVVITSTIGAILMAAGIFRSVASIALRLPNWGWSLLSGVSAFVLGSLLLSGWQATSLWFLGFAVGIDLIFHGFSWIMFSFGVHRLAKDLATTEAERRAA